MQRARRRAEDFSGKSIQAPDTWTSPTQPFPCSRCGGQIMANHRMTGGFLPIFRRVGEGWEQRLTACPDCELGRWRSHAQGITPYNSFRVTLPRLNTTELYVLGCELLQKPAPKTLVEAARRLPSHEPARARILAACEDAATLERGGVQFEQKAMF